MGSVLISMAIDSWALQILQVKNLCDDNFWSISWHNFTDIIIGSFQTICVLQIRTSNQVSVCL